MGARPRLRVTSADPPRCWTEQAEWHGLRATLRLDLDAAGADRCRLSASFRIDGHLVRGGRSRPFSNAWRRPRIASDLRRAVRLAERA